MRFCCFSCIVQGKNAKECVGGKLIFEFVVRRRRRVVSNVLSARPFAVASRRAVDGKFSDSLLVGVGWRGNKGLVVLPPL